MVGVVPLLARWTMRRAGRRFDRETYRGWLQTLRGGGQGERPGPLCRAENGQRLSVPGVASWLLEAVDVVGVAVARADQLAGARQLERDSHDGVRHAAPLGVDDFDQHVRKVVAAGGEGSDVGGKPEGGRRYRLTTRRFVRVTDCACCSTRSRS